MATISRWRSPGKHSQGSEGRSADVNDAGALGAPLQQQDRVERAGEENGEAAEKSHCENRRSQSPTMELGAAVPVTRSTERQEPTPYGFRGAATATRRRRIKPFVQPGGSATRSNGLSGGRFPLRSRAG